MRISCRNQIPPYYSTGFQVELLLGHNLGQWITSLHSFIPWYISSLNLHLLKVVVVVLGMFHVMTG